MTGTDAYLETMIPLAVALALGLLIGLERGWSLRGAEEGSRVAGVRTYGLIGLLGGLCGLISEKPALIFAGLGFAGLTAVLIAAHTQSVKRTNDVGITSLTASLVTFALGAATTLGYIAEAAAAAVVTAILLGAKHRIHRWVDALEAEELRAALKLLLISLVVLPVLPNRGFGPWGTLNPFEIWWMVVLVAAISFVGYFAMRIAGTGKGALLTGLFAGLASSTALTLHFSHLSRKRPEAVAMLSAGVLLACGTMFPRMLVVAGIVHPALLRDLAPPALAMAAIVYLGAFASYRLASAAERGGTRAQDTDAPPARLDNPLDLRAALIFGALLGAIMLAGEALERGFGDAGVLGLAAVSGISDVDAITLTVARMSASDTPAALAVAAIVLASAVNGLAKAAITLAVGNRAIALRVGLPLLLAAAAGLAIAMVGYG